MTQNKSSNQPSNLPVFFVHAKGRRTASPEDFAALLELGSPVCSRMGGRGGEQTTDGLAQPGSLLRELSERYPGRPVAIIRAGLRPSRKQITELTSLFDRFDEPLALTLLSNACIELNPFADLQAPGEEVEYEPAELVELLAPGYIHTLKHWADHFVLLSPASVERMAEGEGDGTLMQLLTAAGGRLAVPDHLFLQDRNARLFQRRKLEPHESVCPPPFGDLSARLQDWINAGIKRLPYPSTESGAATLHITHSWGGGIAHWIETFIDADRKHVHLQLRAEGPQSDLGCGQKLSLYAGNELGCAVAGWWLQPPIRSIEDHRADYRTVLEFVCRRYRIGRVIVSSLIGHSLDALRTALPTLQVLHDHFPLWPLLSVHPGPYLRADKPVDMYKALAGRPRKQEFTDKDAKGWRDVQQAYVKALAEHGVKLAAPCQAVLDLQAGLEPGLDTTTARVIPHGSALTAAQASIEPRPRPDGRLRMVVLGRIQTGKGQQLLLDSLQELTRYVHVYLLGSGRSGENFFGASGVDVIPEYELEQLPGILQTIGPHFAALLSIVPETFSFTLSELQLLGIPALATRVGSLPDRIVHGKTGWLIDPDPQALIAQVSELCESPEDIHAVRLALGDVLVQTAQEMLAAYDAAFPPVPEAATFLPFEPEAGHPQLAASSYRLSLVEEELDTSLEQQRKLSGELEARTEYLSRELEIRSQWALDTNRQLSRELEARGRVEETLTELSAQHRLLEVQFRKLGDRYDKLSEFNASILSSHSWRITAPLRAARRLGSNFMLAKAWNPIRWPSLVLDFSANVSKLGLKGALLNLQYPDPVTPEPEHLETTETIDEQEPPRSFPEVKCPDVSVVIPVHNKWRYTAACLKSLAETAGEYSFEVIVVDDASEDKTEESLIAIRGLTCLRNEENLGFVGSCNRGARHARGEYLVMLNNDTQVLDGWLDALVNTLKREPSAGLVGARLVYPDGRLQESGGIIFADGSGWNYGRDDLAAKPAYNFLREVDYCSGACIALRTELFSELGGFDERYAPAYYEDTDLAFRIRDAGLKVLVQPASTVIHHEGVTSGTDITAGVKQYQGINQEKFVDRWRQALKLQPGSITDMNDHKALRAASSHRLRGRVLFISAEASGFGPASDAERLFELLQCCRRLGFGVTFVPHGNDLAEGLVEELQAAGVEVIDEPWLSPLEDFFTERGNEFDYVFISRHHVAAEHLSLIDRYCPNSRFILDTVYLEYLLEEAEEGGAESRLPVKSGDRARELELSIIKAADATLVGSPIERKVLEKDAPGQRVHLLARSRSGGSVEVNSAACKALAELFESFD